MNARIPPGRRLAAARAAWVIAVIGMLALFVAGVPAYYDQQRSFCLQATCPLGQLSPQDERALQQAGLSLDFYAAYNVGLEVVVALAASVMGALLFRRRSDDWMVLLVSLAIVSTPVLFGGAVVALAEAQPGWTAAIKVLTLLGLVGAVGLLYFFPEGRLTPRWIIPLPAAVVVFVLVWSFARPGLEGVDVPLWMWLLEVVGVLGGGVFVQLFRYRRLSGPTQRQQTKWVLAGLVTVLAGNLFAIAVLFFLVQSGAAPIYGFLAAITVGWLSVLFLLLAFAIAIVRYRLWDIHVLVNRALVYGALTVGVVGLYVLIVGSLGNLFQARARSLIAFLAAGLIAVLFQPLRLWLQRGVNRLMYGERDDPYAVLARLGRRLEATAAPDAALPAIVETVAQALKLPYAAIALKDGGEMRVVAETPPLSPPTSGGMKGGVGEGGEVFPLRYQNETIGELILAPRAPGEGFSDADRRLLRNIARQAGAAVRAASLLADLQRSRERLVAAREEERRRLRRDLHDGLGPTLASQTLRLDAALEYLASESGAGSTAASELLLELKKQMQATVADVRRLVYELRPPALDELGLVGAVRAYAGGGATQHAGLRVAVTAPPQGLPLLPAAVEVSAYRIALEALTNAIRHARARNCLIRFTLESTVGQADQLQLEIRDDGCGLPGNYQAGIGLASMRERAEELGGTFEIAAASSEGGTRVLARLPLPGDS